MLGSHRLGATIEVRRLATHLHDGLCARCAGPLYFSDLSWFPVSDYIKNMEYMDDRKFIEVRVCQKL